MLLVSQLKLTSTQVNFSPILATVSFVTQSTCQIQIQIQCQEQDVQEEPESPRPVKMKATRWKSQDAGNAHEVKTMKRVHCKRNLYAENMSKKEEEHHIHLEENQQRHAEKHRKEGERRMRAAAKLANKTESEDENEEDVKPKYKPKANYRKSQNPRKQQTQITTCAERRQERRKETAKYVYTSSSLYTALVRVDYHCWHMVLLVDQSVSYVLKC